MHCFIKRLDSLLIKEPTALILSVLNGFQEVYPDQLLEWNKVIKDSLSPEVTLFQVTLTSKEGLLGTISTLLKPLTSYYIFERMLIVTAAQFYSNVAKQFVASRTITFYSKEPLSLYETLLSFFALGLWLGVLEGFAYLQHQ